MKLLKTVLILSLSFSAMAQNSFYTANPKYDVKVSDDCHSERDYLGNTHSDITVKGDSIDGGLFNVSVIKKTYTFYWTHYEGQSDVERCERFAKKIEKKGSSGLTKKEIERLYNSSMWIPSTVYR